MPTIVDARWNLTLGRLMQMGGDTWRRDAVCGGEDCSGRPGIALLSEGCGNWEMREGGLGRREIGCLLLIAEMCMGRLVMTMGDDWDDC